MYNNNMEMSEMSTIDPYKEESYNRFLELLSMDYLYNWKALASVLKVDQRTIYRWRQTPAAQKIVNDEISRLVREMERAGKDDWRMFREKAKIMGVEDVNKIEVVDTKGILDKLETDYANLGERAKIEANEEDTLVGATEK